MQSGLTTDQIRELPISQNYSDLQKFIPGVMYNADTFRGPSADAGTVYELGYMAGRGKLCFGYSNDPAVYRGSFIYDASSARDDARRAWSVYLPRFTNGVEIIVNGVEILDSRRDPSARSAWCLLSDVSID